MSRRCQVHVRWRRWRFMGVQSALLLPAVNHRDRRVGRRDRRGCHDDRRIGHDDRRCCHDDRRVGRRDRCGCQHDRYVGRRDRCPGRPHQRMRRRGRGVRSPRRIPISTSPRTHSSATESCDRWTESSLHFKTHPGRPPVRLRARLCGRAPRDALAGDAASGDAARERRPSRRGRRLSYAYRGSEFHQLN